MSQTIIAVAALLFVTLMGLASFRRIAVGFRLGFDVVCFACISAYFIRAKIFPIFPPLNGDLDVSGLSLRVAAGAWWIFGARLVVVLLRLAFHRGDRSRGARLFSDLSAAGVYIATGIVILNSVFALPVTGLVATSGLVAIVLGLALQNTLADVFAGIAVGIEGPFRIGDRIQINDKFEGLVVEANWRSIRMQTDGDDVVVIPNSIVAKAEIVNRSSPSERRAGSVELSCPKNAVPERVIETAVNATLLCPSILAHPGPAAVLIRVGVRTNSYRVSFHVETTRELETTKDLLLRLVRRHLHHAGLLDAHGDLQVAVDDGAGSLVARRLVKDAVLFECLNQDQIGEVAGSLELLRLEPGETLFAQGQAGGSLYLIASGVIEVSRVSHGATDTLGCIGAGDYIGEIGLLTGAAHAATAKARTHCNVFQLSHEIVASLMGRNGELVAAFDKSARKGLEILHREVAARSAPSVGGASQLLTRIRSFLELKRPPLGQGRGSDPSG